MSETAAALFARPPLRFVVQVDVPCACLLPQASSPDEEALVAGAAFAGYRLESRTTNRITVELLRTGDVLEYEVGAGDAGWTGTDWTGMVRVTVTGNTAECRAVMIPCETYDTNTSPTLTFVQGPSPYRVPDPGRVGMCACGEGEGCNAVMSGQGNRKTRVLVQRFPRSWPCWSSTATASACPSSRAAPTAASACSARAPTP